MKNKPLMEFLSSRSKNENHTTLVDDIISFQSQENLSSSRKTSCDRSLSCNNIARKNKHTSMKTPRRHTEIIRRVDVGKVDARKVGVAEAEKWSKYEYEHFWNQIDSLRTSYADRFSINQPSRVDSQVPIATIRYSNYTGKTMLERNASNGDNSKSFDIFF